ncbi:TPA: RHS domain-containing protein [Enterobacter asburiae]|nr:RHS domain-containing protein [Enterobacter asburiae]
MERVPPAAGAARGCAADLRLQRSGQLRSAPLARIDGVDAPEIFWFHCQPNGTPERMTDIEGQVR